ncbi:amidase [Archangium minus]|uniref:Amidase n=2 Tax=Archangium minus TaxID=83450 RepID=A0ABY9WQ84_9BACT|nr:amidase [Archangium minus]
MTWTSSGYEPEFRQNHVIMLSNPGMESTLSDKTRSGSGRREFLVRLGTLGAMGAVSGLLHACDTCEEPDAAKGATQLSAAEAARRIREGEMSAESYAGALLRAYRARAELNTVLWMDSERLLESARAIDRRRARGQVLGLLAGVPLMVKDNIDVAGIPTTAGTPALRQYVPRQNAPVMDALFAQDALLFAKANMHELAAGASSNNAAFGSVRNPYDRTRIPGGSSGGTAAAVAARFVPAGLGTDTAGSVRIPAALCGICGLRPTVSAPMRWPDAGVVPLSNDLDTVGPIARSVGDLALLTQAVTGVVSPTRASLSGVRIGLPREYFWDDLDPGVAAVTQGAVTRLRDAGVEFVEVNLTEVVQSSLDLFRTFVEIGYGKDLQTFLAAYAPDITMQQVISGIASKDVRALFESLLPVQVPEETVHFVRNRARPELVARYTEVLRSANVVAILYPTVPVPATPIRTAGDAPGDTIELNDRQVVEVFTLIRNTQISPVLRAPGLSIPAGMTAAGLPVGIELDAVPGDDTRLLALGMAVEAALGPLPPPTG